MSPVRLELQRGDIIRVQADVCVSSIHRSKNLTMGPLAKQIHKCGGPGIQQELLERDPGQELKIGQVEVVSPGKLHRFKQLNFVCLCSYQLGNENILQQSILECLELAAINKFKSLAFPALGVGHGFPPETVASCLIEAVALHNLQFPDTSLEVVHIVLLDHDVDVIKAFLLMCAKGTTDIQTCTTKRPSGDVACDLDDPFVNLRIEGIHNLAGSGSTQAHSGAANMKSRITQKQPAFPSHLPKVTGQKKAGAQPQQAAYVNPFPSKISGLLQLARYTFAVGPLIFTVKPNLTNKTFGVQMDMGINISFLDSFIPSSLKAFWQQIIK